MSQELDFSEFLEKFERLESVKDLLPGMKREFLDSLGRRMLSTVRGNLGGTGKVQSWQEYRVGTRSGYAAVSPKAKLLYKDYAAGYVTNAIESGHRIRSPSGQAKGRYRPRITKPKVPGRFFYKGSEAETARLAENAAKELAENIARKIEEAMSK